MAFVHLHNHSDYSMLDAATKIPDMVKRAVDLDMPALALTDHGYMFGVPDFDLECRKYNDAQKDMKQWKHDVRVLQEGLGARGARARRRRRRPARPRPRPVGLRRGRLGGVRP